MAYLRYQNKLGLCIHATCMLGWFTASDTKNYNEGRCAIWGTPANVKYRGLLLRTGWTIEHL